MTDKYKALREAIHNSQTARHRATKCQTIDVSVLLAERDALLEALQRIVASDDAHATLHAPDDDDVARMIEYAEAFDAARAAISAATKGNES